MPGEVNREVLRANEGDPEESVCAQQVVLPINQLMRNVVSVKVRLTDIGREAPRIYIDEEVL